MSRAAVLLASGAALCASAVAQVSCGCDAGDSACEMRQNATSYYYLCDGGARFQQCKADIEKSQTCECLAHGECRSVAAEMLMNPKACADKCLYPGFLDVICPNWDDEQSWCGFYAQLHCTVRASECSRVRPVLSPCEAHCDEEASARADPEDQFEAFLGCVQKCSAAGPEAPAAARGPEPQVSCGCDLADDACEMRQNSSVSYYLCDGSERFKQCRKDIEQSQTCECLAMGPCKSVAAEVLMLNPKACSDACAAPRAVEDLCPNWDDANSWCGYYGQLHCALHTAQCTTKPELSSCEAACDKKATGASEDDRLDSFLQCVQGCKKDAKIFV